ncbi:hypothetical protein HOD96_04125 [Candidatus Falkowbacteria bacterium]|jgi:hypothetical protein|nr:hypothetical protein [Candidatus Falkowbacteria bacterium]MBT4433135.1 hypothetical protein [Candidatus Falkowbacteria bacterium]
MQKQKQNFSDDQDLNLELEEDLKIEEDQLIKKVKDQDNSESDNEKEQDIVDDDEEKDDESDKINYLKRNLVKIQTQVTQLLSYLDGGDIPLPKKEEGISLKQSRELKQSESKEGQKEIEGVFTGEEMIGPDGKRYSIPSNYASKSMLVEGDMLKLIIEADGTFVYKQIGPTERDRLVGTLIKNEVTSQYYAMVEGNRFKLLRASVTYFNGDVGDEVIILTPQGAKSDWAAVENIIKKG